MPVSDLAPGQTLNAGEFDKFRRLAYETFGLDLRAGKEPLVAARLEKQMRAAGCRTFEEYYRHVTGDSTGQSLIRLIDALTTNHTSFFREQGHFDFLRGTIVPQWKNRGRIEVWSVACSTGEEPYSIAMCLAEALGTTGPGKVRILATDISTRVLDTARQAVYPAERFSAIPAAMMRQFWLRGEGEWAGWYRAKREVRALVEFGRLNLLESMASVGTVPLIFCRNVMIYFDKLTQQRVVKGLSGRLEPGGYLFIGHAESLNGISHDLEYVRPAIYRKPAARLWERSGR